MKTYIKKDVIDDAAELTGINPKIVAPIVAHMFNSLTDIVIGEDLELRIEIRDFGVFEVKKTNPRPNARNPKTGKIVSVPARRKVHFKPGRNIKKVLSRPI